MLRGKHLRSVESSTLKFKGLSPLLSRLLKVEVLSTSLSSSLIMISLCPSIP